MSYKMIQSTDRLRTGGTDDLNPPADSIQMTLALPSMCHLIIRTPLALWRQWPTWYFRSDIHLLMEYICDRTAWYRALLRLCITFPLNVRHDIIGSV